MQLPLARSRRIHASIQIVGSARRRLRQAMQMGALVLGTAIISSNSAAAQASVPAMLPGTERDLKFDRKMARLDLENEKKYAFYYKRGGTSIGFKIAKRGERKSGKPFRKKGMFVPLNSSSIPEAEVVSYRLSRLLQVSDLFNPVTYYTLGPDATWRFKKMIRRNESDEFRQENADKLRRKLRRDDGSMFGIYKFRNKRRSQAVTRLCRDNGLNRRHFLARYIRASGPMPSDERVRLRGITRDKRTHKRPRESKRELARQLSIIFVMDMLTGQWDRFSGTNLEAIAHKDGRLQFIARDNGGAELNGDWTWYERYSNWVSRFDYAFVERLVALNDFLKDRTNAFAGFTDKDVLRQTLGFRSGTSFRHFRRKLRAFAERRLPKLIGRYGEDVFFP